MASPALGSHTHDAEKLTAALAKMTVGDGARAKSATAKRGGCLSGRDSLKASAACVRKASPSWTSVIQQTKNFNLTAATFDFTPPLGAPSYPPWARGRKRFVPTRYSNKTKTKKLSVPKAFLVQHPPVPSKHRQSRPPARDSLLTLLTLPPEIRNLVFSLVIGTNSQHHAQLRKVFVRRDAGRSSTQIIRRFPIQPSVSAVNHQLREEVLSMFYGAKRLEFKHSLARYKDISIINMSSLDSIVRYARGWSAARYLTRTSIKLSTRYSSRLYDLEIIGAGQVKVTLRFEIFCASMRPISNSSFVISTVDLTTPCETTHLNGLLGLMAVLAVGRSGMDDEAILRELGE